MTELDPELRAVAHALVADAPAPPPFGAGAAASRTRPVVPTVAAVAALAAAVLTAVVVAGGGGTTQVGTSPGAPGATGPTAPPTAVPSFTCGTEPPVTVTVLGATDGPVAGPAPGNPAAAPGQFVTHWLRADGAVELR